MQHVFVYGTLLFPEILEGLTGKVFNLKDAELKNYQRVQISSGDFPAIVEKEDESVKGKLILDVDPLSMEILLFYEGEDYDCMELEVETETEKLPAKVFVWNNDPEYLIDADWDTEHFKQQFLQDYISFVVPETREAFERLFS